MKRVSLALAVLLAVLLPLGAIAEGDALIGNVAVEEQELTAESAIRIPGNCIIDGPYAEWYSDKAIAENYTFGFFETQESGKESIGWDFPADTHTPLSVWFDFTNMSQEETKLLPRLSCEIVYDGKYVFETTPMQYNPDQVNEDGYSYPSIDAVPLPPLFGTEVYFCTNVPKLVRDTDQPLVARVTLDGSVVFTIDMRDVVTTFNGDE